MKYHRENYDIDKICPLWADYQVVQFDKTKLNHFGDRLRYWIHW